MDCRCCGKPLNPVEHMVGLTATIKDGHPIHTRCIPKHWGKHSNGVNNSRCKEFGDAIRSM